MKKLRALKLKQRLTEAAEEVYELFEKMIEEYEEELRRRREENQRQQRLLEAIYNPQLQLYTADVQQLLNQEDPEMPPHRKEDQEDPETPQHVKEEEEEEDLRSCQEGEQLPVTVKSEDDEEEPPSSQMEAGADVEDCGGPEPARTSDPDPDPGPGVSSETDISDDDWKETREPQSGLNSLNNHELPVSDSTCGAGEKPFNCSECGKRFGTKSCLKRHMRCHTGEKPYSCSVCQKSFTQSGSLQTHRRRHTEEKPYSCSVCDQRFAWRRQIRTHQCAARQSSQLRQTEDIREAAPPASSSTNQMDADGEDCGGPEPTRTSDPDTDEVGDCEKPERGDSDDGQKETREPQSALINNKVPVSDDRCNTRKKPFSCSECGKSFPSRTHLRVHTLIHTGEKPFSCTVCGRRFNQKANLIRHMVRHTGEKAFSCSVCKKRFKYRGDVGRHMKLHTRDKLSTSCVTDSQTAGSHRDIHCLKPGTGVSNCDTTSHLCAECGNRFSSKASLEEHMMIHTGEKPSSLDQEDPEPPPHIKEKEELPFTPLPVKSEHDEEEPKADGEDCGGPELDGHLYPDTQDRSGDSSETERDNGDDDQKETGQPQSGLNPLINEGGPVSDGRAEKPASCTFCGKSFTRKYSLKVHMRLHTGEKPFSCSVCGKGFVQRYHYLEHTRCHTGENTFDCSVCGKKFGHNFRLQSHMRTHTGERPVSCSLCSKGFRYNGELIQHMRVHSGEKPFSCSVCHKTFRLKCILNNHMKIHSREQRSNLRHETDVQTA